MENENMALNDSPEKIRKENFNYLYYPKSLYPIQIFQYMLNFHLGHLLKVSNNTIKCKNSITF